MESVEHEVVLDQASGHVCLVSEELEQLRLNYSTLAISCDVRSSRVV